MKGRRDKRLWPRILRELRKDGLHVSCAEIGRRIREPERSVYASMSAMNTSSRHWVSPDGFWNRRARFAITPKGVIALAVWEAR